MRLLKEFTTRELIDALSYDFDPLQGMAMPGPTGNETPGASWRRQTPRSARVSALEVAIRAQAKKFLAHPLVVQQLEAIWAGTIVFHSVADNLHREMEPKHAISLQGYRNMQEDHSPGRGPSRQPPPVKPAHSGSPTPPTVRRTVTLYDPRDASLFKLSRLRVPRYRSLFSTLSFAIMLGLFVAVLLQKSDDITALEVLFWFWSAGYMLDEVVGWSEQGFGLYIMSVWNAFDLGILFMFMVYYVLRLYGILITDTERHHVARMAYDVLAATAVLLFPRLFSALDHYRYFSQLLIAFRMMAMDMVAILLLILIACSGFFVAFTLAFRADFAASNAAYALFQLVMGFTPAAWDMWGDSNPLGKALLTLFLFICHFLIVTILITVLTNSFMAVVQNANEEHQFLFAVNTISMVKSDALFSYIAPSNIIGWLAIPLKMFMPFRQFVYMNRLIIKITHMPILFSIFLYERLLLSNLAYEPADLVEQRGRTRGPRPAFSIRGAGDLFSPTARLREPSITTFRKDRALEEVFRRPFRDPSVQGSAMQPPTRRKSSNVVTDWMRGMGNDEDTYSPQEDTRSMLDRLEGRTRPSLRRAKTSGYIPKRRRHPLASAQPGIASDPDDHTYEHPIITEEQEPDMSMDDMPHQTDADGDDELGTEVPNDDNRVPSRYETSEDEFFRTPMTARPRSSAIASTPHSSSSHGEQATSPSKRQSRPSRHMRNWSSNTVLFSPAKPQPPSTNSRSSSHSPSPPRRPPTGTRSGTATPGRVNTTADGRRTPKRPPLAPLQASSRPRAILPPKDLRISSSRPNSMNAAGFLSLDQGRRREPSFSAVALDLASDLGDNRHIPDFGALGGLPASFTTQFEMAERMRMARGGGGGNSSDRERDDDSKRMSRIMLARMTTLEEGFRDVLKEVKGLRGRSEDGIGIGGNSSRNGSGVVTGGERSQGEGVGGSASAAGNNAGKKKRVRKKSGRRVLDGERMGSSV